MKLKQEYSHKQLSPLQEKIWTQQFLHPNNTSKQKHKKNWNKEPFQCVKQKPNRGKVREKCGEQLLKFMSDYWKTWAIEQKATLGNKQNLNPNK